MSWKGDDEDQKFWNFMIFKIYATDKEMDEMMPVLGVIAIVCLIGIGLWAIFG